MSDAEVRRSRRTNKGVNTRLMNELKLEEELASNTLKKNVNNNNDNKNKKKQKSKKPKEVVRCLICGTIDSNYNEDEDDKGLMTQCEKCETWQHAKCIFNTTNQRKLPKNYVCFTCDPNYDERYKGIEDRCVLKYDDYIKELNGSGSEEESEPQSEEVSDIEEEEDVKLSENEDEDEEFKSERPQRATRPLRKSLTSDTNKKVNNNNNNVKEDKYNKTRDSVINQFSKKFISYFQNDSNKISKCNEISIELEKEIFNMFNKEISNEYLTKVRSLLFNISNTKVPIIDKLINKEIKVNELVNFSKEDFMDDEERQKLKDILQKSINQVVLVNNNNQDELTNGSGIRIKRTHKGEEIIEMNDELFHSGIIDKEKEKEELIRLKRQKLELTKEEINDNDNDNNNNSNNNNYKEENKENTEENKENKKEDESINTDFNVNLLTSYHNEPDEQEEYENKEIEDDLLDGIIDDDTFIKKDEEESKVEEPKEEPKEEEESSDEFYDPESIGMNREVFKCKLKLLGISEFPIKLNFMKNNNSNISIIDNISQCENIFKFLSNYNELDNEYELIIEGRLDYEKCENYLKQIKLTRDLIISEIKPNFENDDDDNELNNELINSLYNKMTNYFIKRSKIGVINTKKNELIKDVYLINKKQSFKLIKELFGNDEIIENNEVGELLIIMVVKKGLTNFKNSYNSNELNNLLNVLN